MGLMMLLRGMMRDDSMILQGDSMTLRSSRTEEHCSRKLLTITDELLRQREITNLAGEEATNDQHLAALPLDTTDNVIDAFTEYI